MSLQGSQAVLVAASLQLLDPARCLHIPWGTFGMNTALSSHVSDPTTSPGTPYQGLWWLQVARQRYLPQQKHSMGALPALQALLLWLQLLRQLWEAYVTAAVDHGAAHAGPSEPAYRGKKFELAFCMLARMHPGLTMVSGAERTSLKPNSSCSLIALLLALLPCEGDCRPGSICWLRS